MQAPEWWWVVAYSDLKEKIGSFVLFAVYDNYHPWQLSLDMICCICDVHLSTMLGYRGVGNKMVRLLEVFERKNVAC